MPVTPENLPDVIKYHAPDADQLASIAIIREATQNLCDAILTHAPKCGDQQAAIRHAREAMMTANAAIVLKGTV